MNLQPPSSPIQRVNISDAKTMDELIDCFILKRREIYGRSHSRRYDGMILAFFQMGRIPKEQYLRYLRREFSAPEGR